jgi:hypothetical protein
MKSCENHLNSSKMRVLHVDDLVEFNGEVYANWRLSGAIGIQYLNCNGIMIIRPMLAQEAEADDDVATAETADSWIISINPEDALKLTAASQEMAFYVEKDRIVL